MVNRNNTIMRRIKQEARRRGLAWSAVEDAYREVKAAEREKRERPNEIRSFAWFIATASTPGSWPFWRHGFYSRWGHRIARGADYTVIPGYDEIGQQIGGAFPEYTDDTGTERLFEFLLSPYDKLPSREEMYDAALDLAELSADQTATETHNDLEF